MAKTADAASLAEKLISDAKNGLFAPVYLLMGEEPYYVDLVSDAIVKYALEEDQRDFNQFIMYGADTTVEDVIANARRYPMFSDRQLVVLREAQSLKAVEELSVYTDAPLDSTVFVIVYRGKADKRRALYKSVSNSGVVLESNPVRDYEMPGWISSYFASRGLSIDSDAAALFAEFAGTDLNKISVETGKLLKNLPEGVTKVTSSDIEANVGISREFSVFELTRLLSYKQTAKALRTASFMSSAARFALPAVTAPLFNHFNRILRYEALLLKSPSPSSEEKQAVLGVAPFFFKEYDAAVRNYPLRSCMNVISLITEYDYKGKGGDSGEADAGELLMELITKILYS